MLQLYRVFCKGLHGTLSRSHGIAFVVANDPAEAYSKLLSHLENEDIGTDKDRALDKVELIAQDVPYPNCGTRLYL